MSTRRCIKFGIVIFLQLTVPTAFDTACAQVNPNLQSQVQQTAPSMGVQTPVFQSGQPRPRALHHPKKHRVGHANQSRQRSDASRPQ
jgi:hypothetical protein